MPPRGMEDGAAPDPEKRHSLWYFYLNFNNKFKF